MGKLVNYGPAVTLSRLAAGPPKKSESIETDSVLPVPVLPDAALLALIPQGLKRETGRFNFHSQVRSMIPSRGLLRAECLIHQL